MACNKYPGNSTIHSFAQVHGKMPCSHYEENVSLLFLFRTGAFKGAKTFSAL